MLLYWINYFKYIIKECHSTIRGHVIPVDGMTFQRTIGTFVAALKINPLRVHSIISVDNGKPGYRWEALCDRGDRDKNGFHEISSRWTLWKAQRGSLLFPFPMNMRRACVAWLRYIKPRKGARLPGRNKFKYPRDPLIC